MEGDRVVANIYQHSDGHPDGVLPELQRFFEAVESQTKDRRFANAEYLAAKFVVWYAAEMTKKTKWRPEANQLDFLGVGICMQDHVDIEFAYIVDCGDLDAGRPTVKQAKLE